MLLNSVLKVSDMMIYVCADDYGMSRQTCGRIADCVKNGALNKISIFPNSPMADIKEYIPGDGVTYGAHINLVEGRPVSDPKDVFLLTDSRGYFKYSFSGLLALSLSPERKEFKRQIYTEIKNQLIRWKEIVPTDAAVIDSHQHTHMIPAVFECMMRVIKNENIGVRYIRIPSEPIMPYLRAAELYGTYRPVNIAKQWILKFFAMVNGGVLKKSGIKSALFMGVMFSGNMDEQRVPRIFEEYKKLAEKKKCDIEILFHPGYVNRGEPVMDGKKTGFNKFYYSKYRRTEFDTLKKIEIK